jgi:colicin import membrane protein
MFMMTTRDDSVLTSIQEIQRLEHERLRELARREADAKQALEAKIEAARTAAEREEHERIVALEAQRLAEQEAREFAARAILEAREMREMQLRADAEREHDLRTEARREAHARAMAEIETHTRTGIRAKSLVAILLGTLGLCAGAAYLIAYKPMVAAHDARVSELRSRAERADRERDAARTAQASLASRIRAVASLPTIQHAPTIVQPLTRSPSAPRTVRSTANRNSATEAPIDIDGTGEDIFAIDDAARVGNPHRAHR